MLQIGDTIFETWYIKKVIGEGNFGVVYEIEREEFGHRYKAAAKVISIPKGNDIYTDAFDERMTKENMTEYYRSMVEDIISECDMMEEMKGDSHIVSYEDHRVKQRSDNNGFDIYIRMELLTPLGTVFSQKELSENDVIKLGIDICSALETCQKHNIIHRDIKPENIFVSNTGSYKLGDFGIAKALEQNERAMSKKGTQNYMAPEVYRGLSYDSTVDIYSLGLVMYRLLNSNRSPFLAPYPQPISYSDREEALNRRLLGEVLPDACNASPELNHIIRKACSYEPSMRYRMPREMRRDLERLYVEEEEMTYRPQRQTKPVEFPDEGDLNKTRSIFQRVEKEELSQSQQKEEPQDQPQSYQNEELQDQPQSQSKEELQDQLRSQPEGESQEQQIEEYQEQPIEDNQEQLEELSQNQPEEHIKEPEAVNPYDSQIHTDDAEKIIQSVDSSNKIKRWVARVMCVVMGVVLIAVIVTCFSGYKTDYIRVGNNEFGYISIPDYVFKEKSVMEILELDNGDYYYSIAFDDEHWMDMSFYEINQNFSDTSVYDGSMESIEEWILPIWEKCKFDTDIYNVEINGLTGKCFETKFDFIDKLACPVSVYYLQDKNKNLYCIEIAGYDSSVCNEWIQSFSTKKWFWEIGS